MAAPSQPPPGLPSRVCPRCGHSTVVDPRYARSAIPCAHCGAVLGLPRAERVLSARPGGGPVSRWEFLTGYSVSAVIHAVLLFAFIHIVWMTVTREPLKEAQIGVVSGHQGGNIEGGDEGLTPTQVSTPHEMQALQSPDPVAAAPVDNVKEIGVSTATATASPAEAIVGVVGGEGVKANWGALSGSGGGDGMGGVGGGGASFYGLAAKGHRFVFVIDHSGSMVGEKVELAKQELIRSVKALDREAKFYIIFYNDTFDPMQAKDLVPATEQNKRQYLDWVEQTGAGGGTAPIAPMQQALSLKPDAVWLLTDGLYPDPNGTVLAIRNANPGRRIQIHCIAFWANQGEAVLKQIAEENRGHYRFVSPASLGRTPGGPGRPAVPARPPRGRP